MKLAIVIGVSEYQNITSLVACKNDVDIVHNIFQKLGKFDDICMMSGTLNGFEAKQKIIEFINKYKDKNISELVFYYTGHGARYDEDFFYVFSDFNDKRKEATGLRNSELDGLIRNINPDLTIKIIDACYSGSAYIKSYDDIKPTLEKSAKENRLKNLYFFHSSSSDEASLANDLYSFFTFSFCKSIANHSGSIRYRDIMAFVADDMEQSGYPKPTFIVQADNTEIFGEIDSDFRAYVKKTLKIDDKKIESQEETELKDENVRKNALLKLVEEKSINEFCSKEEASTNMSLLRDILNEKKWPDQILELFNIEENKIENSYIIPNNIEIGRWLQKNSEEEYFAHPTFKTQTYYEDEYKKLPQKPTKGINALGALYTMKRSLGLDEEHDYKLEKVEKKRNVIEGFEYSAEAPFRALKLLFKPKYAAIENYSMTIALIFSRRKIAIFVAMEVLPYMTWENVSRSKCINWKVKEVMLKNTEEISVYANELMNSMSSFIVEDISKKLDQ